jgi:hypothetical protein
MHRRIVTNLIDHVMTNPVTNLVFVLWWGWFARIQVGGDEVFDRDTPRAFAPSFGVGK